MKYIRETLETRRADDHATHRPWPNILLAARILTMVPHPPALDERKPLREEPAPLVGKAFSCLYRECLAPSRCGVFAISDLFLLTFYNFLSRLILCRKGREASSRAYQDRRTFANCYRKLDHTRKVWGQNLLWCSLLHIHLINREMRLQDAVSPSKTCSGCEYSLQIRLEPRSATAS